MIFSDQKRGSRRPEQSGRSGASTTTVPLTGSLGLVGAAVDRHKQLVVRELTVEFGGLLALAGVSMSAGYGETVGVIGPNGAGKTTLFNVICGFTRPRSGSIAFGGVGLENARPHDLNRLGLARTLQGVGLCNGLTVLENVMLGAQARLRSDIGSAFLGLGRSSREERRAAAAGRQLLERLGIGAYASRSPSALPYGIQKRTALARALMAAPSMLLLDEPASGLSEQEIDDLADLVRDLKKDMGIVLVEHRIDLVTAVCDRIVVLNFGQVIADGTPDQIRVNPDVATAYLGADVGTAASGPSAQEPGSA
jgi:branched-chain amino acid transport system ATP-binding protein